VAVGSSDVLGIIIVIILLVGVWLKPMTNYRQKSQTQPQIIKCTLHGITKLPTFKHHVLCCTIRKPPKSQKPS
jgi:hypothetical protein